MTRVVRKRAHSATLATEEAGRVEFTNFKYHLCYSDVYLCILNLLQLLKFEKVKINQSMLTHYCFVKVLS